MRNARIFIVEDEALIKMELQDRLERLGHVVCGTAARGEEALDAVAAANPDLVLMDIRLAGTMDGVEAARLLRERTDVPVVYLTAYADDAVLERAAATGPVGYLVKPIAERELVAAVEMALYKHDIEKRLRESELLYRTLAETANDHIFVTMPDLTVRYMNKLAAKSVGSDQDAVVGKRLDALFPPHVITGIRANLNRVLASGEPYAIEEKLAFPGGEIWLSTILSPLKDEHDSVTAVMGISRDVTERRKADEALRTATRQLNEAQRLAHIGSWERDLVTNRITWSDELYRIFGIDRAATPHNFEALLKLVHPDDREPFLSAVKETVEEGKPYSIDYRILRRDGSVTIVHTLGEVVRDRDGKPVLFRGTAQDVTEQRRLASQLGESEQKYRNLFESANDAIFILDERGNFLDANRIAYERLGYTREELLAKHVSALDPPEFASRVPERIRLLRERGKAVFESAHVRKDGSVMPVEINSQMMSYEGRTVLYSIIRDITERKKAEASLRRMNRGLRTLSRCNETLVHARSEAGLLNDICDVIVHEGGYRMCWVGYAERDAARMVLPMNKCGCEEGYLEKINITWGAGARGNGPTGTAIRTGKPALVSDTQHDPLFAPWREAAAQQGYGSVLGLPLASADGEAPLGALTIYAAEKNAFDDDEIRLLQELADDLAYGIGMLRMREAKKRAEEERERLIDDLRAAVDTVSRSQREWQHTFDTITDLIYITDNEFRVLRANKAFAAYCGVEPRELVGRKCFELFHDNGIVPASCPHEESLRTRTLVQREMTDFRKDRVFSIIALPFSSGEGGTASSLIIARDVTEEREKEARLLMAERLATLGQMASGVAHEINNPLAAMAGCTEGLLMRIRKDRYDPEFFTKYLHVIEDEIMRCKTITTSMLSFVRKTTYEQRMIDLVEVLRKTIEIVTIQGRMKSMKLSERHEPGLPQIYGSTGELRQVFLALVTNALDAVNEQGTLTIETWSDASHVYARIADTGPGIAQEHLPRLFAPFYTTKAEKGGTGLGLSIARKIVNGHHGDITVSSEPGRGASFTVILPISRPSAASA